MRMRVQVGTTASEVDRVLSYGQAILLGAIQGLTEFLPVSSSGHLVLGQALLGLDMPGLTLEIMLHVGTALAVALVFRADILRMLSAVAGWRRNDPDFRLFWLLVLGSVPAALVAVFLGELVEQRLASPRIAASLLLVTAVLLLFGPPRAALPERSRRDRRQRQRQGRASAREAWLTAPGAAARGLWVGVAQAVAILPGISRSGSSLVAGMRAGIPRQEAARFSLLLSLPVIFGGAAGDIYKLVRAGDAGLSALPWGPLLAGVGVAFVAGLFAIRGLLLAVQRARLSWFGVYCAVAGVVALLRL